MSATFCLRIWGPLNKLLDLHLCLVPKPFLEWSGYAWSQVPFGGGYAWSKVPSWGGLVCLVPSPFQGVGIPGRYTQSWRLVVATKAGVWYASYWDAFLLQVNNKLVRSSEMDLTSNTNSIFVHPTDGQRQLWVLEYICRYICISFSQYSWKKIYFTTKIWSKCSRSARRFADSLGRTMKVVRPYYGLADETFSYDDNTGDMVWNRGGLSRQFKFVSFETRFLRRCCYFKNI